MVHYGLFSRWLKKALEGFSESSLATIGIIIIGIFAIVAIFAPVFSPYDPYDLDLTSMYQPPSSQHLLGTDNVGRDIFSRILYGSRLAFVIALLIVAIELSISVPLVLLSSYKGGYFDEIAMRIMDIIISIPSLLRAIIIVALLGPNMRNAILAIGIGYMPMLARLVRSVALSIKEGPYIEACRALRYS
jgi:peptide/nickel transport system permease protein